MKLGRLRVTVDSLAGQTLLLAVGRGGAKALSFLGFLVIARALGPVTYGGLTFALSLGSLLAFIPNMGVDPVFSREVPSGRAPARDLLGLMLALKTAGSALFLVVFLGVIYLTPTSTPVRGSAVLIALALTLLAFGETWRTALITTGRAGLAGVLEVVPAAVFLVASIFLMARDPTVSRAALSFLSGQLAAGIVGSVAVLRLLGVPRLPSGAAPYRRVFAMALPLMLIWFLSDLYLRIDMTILYYLRGDGETGLYGASYRLVEGICSAAIVVCSVSLPRMAGAWVRDLGQWRREWRRARQLLLLIIVPGAVVVSIFSGPVIRLLYGASFAGAAQSLRILGPATVALCLGMVYGAALTSVGLVWTQFRITVAALLANVALNFLWIPAYGGGGAALATLVAALGYLALAQQAIRRRVAAAPPPIQAVEISALSRS